MTGELGWGAHGHRAAFWAALLVYCGNCQLLLMVLALSSFHSVSFPH